MKRLIEKTVFSGLVMDCRLATWPTSRSLPFVKPTTHGVVRAPSWLAMTVGCPASITATHEFVVPRSIPIILPMILKNLLINDYSRRGLASGHLVQLQYKSLVCCCQVFAE